MSHTLQQQPRKPAGRSDGGQFDFGDLAAGPTGQDAFPNPYQGTPGDTATAPGEGVPIITTGKAGSSAPPLVAHVQQKGVSGRFYALNPETKERLESGSLDIHEALANREAFPSITTCLGALDKPALPAWAAGLAGERGEQILSDLSHMDPREAQSKIQELLGKERNGRTVVRNLLARAHTEKRDSAADRGTTVHSIVEQRVLGGSPDVPEHLAGYVNAAEQFLADHPTAKFRGLEITVHHKDAAVMGTTDAIVSHGGKSYVLDWKTNDSAKVYASTGMQLAAAANATSIVFANGATMPMPRVDGGIGVALSPHGKYQMYVFETGPDSVHHRGFLAARAAWEWSFLAGHAPKPGRL